MTMTFDKKKITEEITHENEDIIEKIIHSPEVDERRYLMEEFLEFIPRVTVKKMQQNHKKLNDLIMSADSSITEVEISQSHENLKYWDEGDKRKVVKSINTDDIPEMFKNIITEEIYEILEKRKVQKQKSLSQKHSSTDDIDFELQNHLIQKEIADDDMRFQLSLDEVESYNLSNSK